MKIRHRIAIGMIVPCLCLLMQVSVISQDSMPDLSQMIVISLEEKPKAKIEDTREWGESVDGISITLWTTKKEFQWGEPIILYGQIKNEGEEDFMKTYLAVADYYQVFSLLNVDVQGMGTGRTSREVKNGEIPMTAASKFMGSGWESWYLVGAGKHSRAMFGWLNMRNDMSLTGEYRIVAKLPLQKNDSEGKPKYAHSKELRIKVVNNSEDVFSFIPEFRKEVDAELEKWSPY